ncbi:folylpolyglutamate synthase [Cordyceps militaris CM01]|uniref:Folylpolyglutamate synthase n=1 Tax=Cordyceps militaris (strain CM01) TaxID=983644 RepID=G3JDR4_CORMM|nr:folylpolyglutamate synthase [Cordyceps militaris CM01]EGX92739.1 folylpolyglutamate synthase [Cordyceps militaris CM01]
MSSSATTSPRDYEAALAKLNLLASNRAITTLFETPRQGGGGGGGDGPTSPSPPAALDLNAQALPEMLTWLRRAGYTPRDLAAMRHIHVAGTKGKGSVCAFATSLLRTAYRQRGGEPRPVGTYTSPHLVSPRERIAVDGEPVSQAAFATAFWQLWDRFTAAALAEGQPRDVAEGPASKPFYFRFLTILAWHVFLSAGVRDVVMECGIGGEHDATNVLPPEAVSAAVVAQLGIDHVAMLGGTVEEIAWHKAGIFKPGVAAFTLGSAPPVMDVLRRRAVERQARLFEADEEAVDAWAGVESALHGDFQKRNQALAVLAVQEHLGIRDEAASTAETLGHLSATMVTGLRAATLRGRCETLHDEAHGVQWMLDGAHTRDSIEQVARWLAQSLAADELVTLVFNQQERDAPALLAHLVDTTAAAAARGPDVFSRALFTRNEQAASDHGGDLSVQEALAGTMRTLAPGCSVSVFDNVQSAVAEVRKTAGGRGKTQKVLVTGSLHLVGGIMRALEPDGLL